MQGYVLKAWGCLGSPCSSSRAGLAHTTVRMLPMRVATIELSGSAPMRTAMSTRSSMRSTWRSASISRMLICGKAVRKSATTGSTCRRPNISGAVITNSPLGVVNSPSALRSASSTCSRMRRAAAT